MNHVVSFLCMIIFYCSLSIPVCLLQGKEVIQYYIDELIRDGITYIAPFENSQGRPRTKSASEGLVSNADQSEPDVTDTPTIASSAVEAADSLSLAARSGWCMFCSLHQICCDLLIQEDYSCTLIWFCFIEKLDCV